MNPVGTAVGNYVDLAAAVVAVFGVIVIRQNAELCDRIQVWNGCRPAVPALLHRRAVQQESVVRLSLAVHRQRPRTQIARDLGNGESGGVEDAAIRATHARCARYHPRLQRQQICVAARDQRHRCDAVPFNHFTQLRTRGLHVRGFALHLHQFPHFSNLQSDIHNKGGIYVQNQAGFLVALEPRLLHAHFVMPQRQRLK